MNNHTCTHSVLHSQCNEQCPLFNCFIPACPFMNHIQLLAHDKSPHCVMCAHTDHKEGGGQANTLIRYSIISTRYVFTFVSYQMRACNSSPLLFCVHTDHQEGGGRRHQGPLHYCRRAAARPSRERYTTSINHMRAYTKVHAPMFK